MPNHVDQNLFKSDTMSADISAIAITLSLYAGLVISPGPGFALISRMALSGRRDEALATTAGFGVGATVYAALTMGGLAFVILKVDWLARMVQVLGGVYLIWLGIGAWRHAEVPDVETTAPTSASRAFMTGLLVDLSNPKGIAFFLSLYAIAITSDTALWAKVTIVIGSFVLEIVWYSLVTVLLSRPKPQKIYRRFGTAIDQTIGSVLGLIGVKILYEQTRLLLDTGPFPKA